MLADLVACRSLLIFLTSILLKCRVEVSELSEVPRVYLDLDVLSYLAGIPKDEVWKTSAARRVVEMARDGKIVIAVSMAAVEASFSRARLLEERRRRYLRLLASCLEDAPHEVVEPKPENIEKLADLYFEVADVGKYENAVHLAVAVILKADYFLTWDEEHILKESLKKKIQNINKKRGLKTPNFLKPEEFKP